jgi:hypothetical protein
LTCAQYSSSIVNITFVRAAHWARDVRDYARQHILSFHFFERARKLRRKLWKSTVSRRA